MTALAAVFDDYQPVPPKLDRAAIEQARLIRLARDHIAANEGSVDYDGLARGRDCTVLAARQWVKRQRSKGQLIVVDHGAGSLIPTFQLDDVFDVDERVGRAIAALSAEGMNGWAIWQWFVAFNPWIEARPVDVIGSEELGVAVDGITAGTAGANDDAIATDSPKPHDTREGPKGQRKGQG